MGSGGEASSGSAQCRSAGRRYPYPAVRKPHALRHADDLSLSGDRYSHAVWEGALMSECPVDVPRESDSQRSHQESDLDSDDHRRDCGTRQLEEPLDGSATATGTGVEGGRLAGRSTSHRLAQGGSRLVVERAGLRFGRPLVARNTTCTTWPAWRKGYARSWTALLGSASRAQCAQQ